MHSNAEVIDYDLHSAISEVYQELIKLKHAEELMTDLAMKYQAIPAESADLPQIRLASHNNLLNFRRFIDRANDRLTILRRVADISSSVLPLINDQFTPDQLKEIELTLIGNQVQVTTEQQIHQYIPLLQQYFPNLTAEEIQKALSD